MAVKIRLARRGRKKLSLFDIVVADARAPRDGRFIEKIGIYNPNTNPATIELAEDKAFNWVMKGAQPTDTVRAMLSYRGILFKKHLQIGVLKGAISQDQADAKFEEWVKSKSSKIESKKDTLAKQKAESRESRLQAEAKIKEARAEALKKRNTVVEEVAAEQTSNESAESVNEESKQAVTNEDVSADPTTTVENSTEATQTADSSPSESEEVK